MEWNIPCEEEKIEKTIAISKAAFYEKEAAATLSHWEFLVQQNQYIKKHWWLLQGVLLAVLLLILQEAESASYMQRSLGVAAPLFVILALPELWKNRSCGAMEVECTTFYSLRQVYAARLSLFAMVDLALLSLFFLGVSFTAKVTAWDMLVQFVLPFNVACCICFRSLYSVRAGSELFALLLCALWMGMWMQIVLHDAVYQAVSVPVWCGMLALSLLYMGYNIFQGQRKWRKIWEVKPVWN